VANIPNFVTQAEDRIYQSAEFPALQKTAYSYTAAGEKLILTPPDMLAIFSLRIQDVNGATTFLLDKDVSWMSEAYTNDLVTGKPIYYALFDDSTFILAPVPDGTYYIECNYFYKPDSIVTTSTSWLGNKVPSALLYGSLLEAYTYMKGEADILALYQSRYNDALATLKNLGEGRNRLDAYRSGQVRSRKEA
jgi:hypothetical protein